MSNYKKQQGAVLLMAMIFLVVITVIGVSAVSSSGIKTQVAGNNMSSMLVYTGAESTLARSVSDIDKDSMRMTKTVLGEFVVYQIPAVLFPAENTSSGGVLTSGSQMTYEGTKKGCPVTKMASSSGFGGYTCDVWKINAESRLNATNAKDTHIKGIASIDVNIPF